MMAERTVSIVVVGSVNLDFAARVASLPKPGETITGADLLCSPGGKGANQALAARRLGAAVQLVARVGADANADPALALLREAGVDLGQCTTDENTATGVAMIAVAASGENHIVVAPGANRTLHAGVIGKLHADALICQLEVPDDALLCACESFTGFFCINLAPARDVPARLLDRADLLVVNETEAAFYADSIHKGRGLVAVTRGAHGAALHRNGQVLASAKSPVVNAIDTTGAGDAFTAALTVALVEGMTPETALNFACATGACAAMKTGAQTSLPFRDEVEALEKMAKFA